jgi:hypothetical protein
MLAAVRASISPGSKPMLVRISTVFPPTLGAGPRGRMSAPLMRIGAATVRNEPLGCSIIGNMPVAAAWGSAARSAIVDAGP